MQNSSDVKTMERTCEEVNSCSACPGVKSLLLQIIFQELCEEVTYEHFRIRTRKHLVITRAAGAGSSRVVYRGSMGLTSEYLGCSEAVDCRSRSVSIVAQEVSQIEENSGLCSSIPGAVTSKKGVMLGDFGNTWTSQAPKEEIGSEGTHDIRPLSRTRILLWDI